MLSSHGAQTTPGFRYLMHTSTLQLMWARWPREMRRLATDRFREWGSPSVPMLHSYLAQACGAADVLTSDNTLPAGQLTPLAVYIGVSAQHKGRIAQLEVPSKRPKFFVLQDEGSKGSKIQAYAHDTVLRGLYPEPSPWEQPGSLLTSAAGGADPPDPRPIRPQKRKRKEHVERKKRATLGVKLEDRNAMVQLPPKEQWHRELNREAKPRAGRAGYPDKSQFSFVANPRESAAVKFTTSYCDSIRRSNRYAEPRAGWGCW